jgi:hypothetical protein
VTGFTATIDDAGADPAGDKRSPSYTECSQAQSPYQHFLYLDGSCLEAAGDRIKRYPDPEDYDGAWREWQSPLRHGTISDGYYRAVTSVDTARATADTSALDTVIDGGVPDGMQISVINVERDDAGTPYYRYFQSDRTLRAKESWSASKFMAIAAAAAKIRQESSGQVGIDANLAGRHVGELVTKIHNYGAEWSQNLPTSNSLAKFFLDVAGKDWATELVSEWIGSSASEFRGGYGVGPAYRYPTFSTSDASEQVWNAGERGGSKVMTPLAQAEFLKRLVMHREDKATRVPGFRSEGDHQTYWQDLEILFYGQPGWNWGGMQDDTAIYVESAVDLDQLADGEWRIFSKLGYGKNEFVYTAYACLPDERDPTNGSEFVISIHWDRNTAVSGTTKDKQLQETVEDIVAAIDSGAIDYEAEAPEDVQFPDLQNHWAESEVRTLAEDGVVTGYGDGTIRPDTPITRAEFATILVNAFNISSTTAAQSDEIWGDVFGTSPERAGLATPTFSDIDGHWAEEDIERATASGFLSGYSDGTFRPDTPITKTEALVALVNGADWLSSSAPASALDPFIDAEEVPEWATSEVAAAVSEGLVENRPLGEYLEPRADATRAEVLKYVYEASR